MRSRIAPKAYRDSLETCCWLWFHHPDTSPEEKNELQRLLSVLTNARDFAESYSSFPSFLQDWFCNDSLLDMFVALCDSEWAHLDYEPEWYPSESGWRCGLRIFGPGNKPLPAALPEESKESWGFSMGELYSFRSGEKEYDGAVRAACQITSRKILAVECCDGKMRSFYPHECTDFTFSEENRSPSLFSLKVITGWEKPWTQGIRVDFEKEGMVKEEALRLFKEWKERARILEESQEPDEDYGESMSVTLTSRTEIPFLVPCEGQVGNVKICTEENDSDPHSISVCWGLGKVRGKDSSKNISFKIYRGEIHWSSGMYRMGGGGKISVRMIEVFRTLHYHLSMRGISNPVTRFFEEGKGQDSMRACYSR